MACGNDSLLWPTIRYAEKFKRDAVRLVIEEGYAANTADDAEVRSRRIRSRAGRANQAHSRGRFS